MTAMKSLDVVTCGEAMGLFIPTTLSELSEATIFQRVPAGAELNVAIGLSRLGLRVGYLTRLGNDNVGKWLRQVMVDEGISDEHVITDSNYHTGVMFKSKNRDGSDPAVEYIRRGSAASHLSVSDYDATYLKSARHLHVTGISPALSETARELVFSMVSEMRSNGGTVSFDPNIRISLWDSEARMKECLNSLAAISDWVLPGINEGVSLTGSSNPETIADFYLARGSSLVVVKLGDSGAYYATNSESGYCSGFPVVQVVDTVGAGDGFAVGVISGMLDGLSVEAAVKRGTAIGARVVGYPGDSDGLPTRYELMEFMKQSSR